MFAVYCIEALQSVPPMLYMYEYFFILNFVCFAI